MKKSHDRPACQPMLLVAATVASVVGVSVALVAQAVKTYQQN